MKIFNRQKWEAIQRCRADQYQVLQRINEERRDANASFGKVLGYIQSKQSALGLTTACEVISQDDRELTIDQVEAKLKCLSTEWPKICAEFGLNEDFYGKNALVDLYGLMRDKKRIQEAADKASERCSGLVACFNVLNDFAEKHGKGDLTRLNAVQDPGGNSVDYSGDYSAYTPQNLA